MVIKKARYTVLLVVGVEKGLAIIRALESRGDPGEFPVLLLCNSKSIWLLDDGAMSIMKASNFTMRDNL
jgi:6-phosphogluconolactonase/glucosamine-6-phosphate isomerase/deaminase